MLLKPKCSNALAVRQSLLQAKRTIISWHRLYTMTTWNMEKSFSKILLNDNLCLYREPVKWAPLLGYIYSSIAGRWGEFLWLLIHRRELFRVETGDSCLLTHSSPRRSSLGLLLPGLCRTTVSGGSLRMYLQAHSQAFHANHSIAPKSFRTQRTQSRQTHCRGIKLQWISAWQWSPDQTSQSLGVEERWFRPLHYLSLGGFVLLYFTSQHCTIKEVGRKKGGCNRTLKLRRVDDGSRDDVVNYSLHLLNETWARTQTVWSVPQLDRRAIW